MRGASARRNNSLGREKQTHCDRAAGSRGREQRDARSGVGAVRSIGSAPLSGRAAAWLAGEAPEVAHDAATARGRIVADGASLAERRKCRRRQHRRARAARPHPPSRSRAIFACLGGALDGAVGSMPSMRDFVNDRSTSVATARGKGRQADPGVSDCAEMCLTRSARSTGRSLGFYSKR
jgi:hypothetical protein